MWGTQKEKNKFRILVDIFSTVCCFNNNQICIHIHSMHFFDAQMGIKYKYRIRSKLNSHDGIICIIN